MSSDRSSSSTDSILVAVDMNHGLRPRDVDVRGEPRTCTLAGASVVRGFDSFGNLEGQLQEKGLTKVGMSGAGALLSIYLCLGGLLTEGFLVWVGSMANARLVVSRLTNCDHSHVCFSLFQQMPDHLVGPIFPPLRECCQLVTLSTSGGFLSLTA